MFADSFNRKFDSRCGLQSTGYIDEDRITANTRRTSGENGSLLASVIVGLAGVQERSRWIG